MFHFTSSQTGSTAFKATDVLAFFSKWPNESTSTSQKTSEIVKIAINNVDHHRRRHHHRHRYLPSLTITFTDFPYSFLTLNFLHQITFLTLN